MLVELAIRDFAIIEETRIPFEDGLNALTGETGAGKSILIDALGAVLGERVSADMVRTGAKAARIEATFDVAAVQDRPDVAAAFEELGVEPEDGVVILSREIGAAGRGGARINGRAVTAGALARVGALLVDIHGQSDHLSLLRPAEHLEMLDRFAGLQADRAAVRDAVLAWREVRDRIADLTTNARERAQRADLLRFQAEEIAAAALVPGEEEALLAERNVLANAERLVEDAAAAHALLAGEDEVDPMAVPAVQALRLAAQRLADIAGLDPAASGLSDRVNEALFLLEDVVSEVRDYRDVVEANPARLAEVEERLDAIKALKRKYGATIEDVLRFGQEASRELKGLVGDEGNLDTLRAREEKLRAQSGRLAARLSARRAEAGGRLAVAVERAATSSAVLGGDANFWEHVGIDPVRIMTSSGTLYTLRCYFDDKPIFLGRNGRISVFGSERALARYLADEHDHDLSDLSTYDDIRTAATDGSLRVDVTDDNVYVLSGLVDDIADGIVTATASPAGLNEDFNISAGRELTVAEIAEIIWGACGRDPEKFALETGPSFEVDVVRRWPDVSKAQDVLGWRARIDVEDGVADTVAWLRETL